MSTATVNSTPNGTMAGTGGDDEFDLDISIVESCRAVEAEAIPDIAEQVCALYAIADEMARHNRATAPDEQAGQRVDLAERMRLIDRAVEHGRPAHGP